MAFWLKTGDLEVGVSDGVVRRNDFAALVEACQLNSQAEARLEHAEEQASHIIDEALEEAQRLHRTAQEEGEQLRLQAREQGLREAAEQWAQEMAQKALLAHHSIQKASDRLAELVSLAAQRVIEVEDKGGLYRRALRAMRELTQDSKTLTLYVGLDDADYALSVLGQLTQEMGVPVPLEIKVDDRLAVGGCVLESDFGVIDASMGLQIEAIKRAISNAARAALSSAKAVAPQAMSAHQQPIEVPQAEALAIDAIESEPFTTDALTAQPLTVPLQDLEAQTHGA
jgi:type III secretion protein L